MSWVAAAGPRARPESPPARRPLPVPASLASAKPSGVSWKWSWSDSRYRESVWRAGCKRRARSLLHTGMTFAHRNGHTDAPSLHSEMRRREPMPPEPLMLSLETVLAASPLLGHKLEDRSRIRAGQDPSLVAAFQEASTIPLSNPQQRALFLVAPLDILVADCDGAKQFHIAETNGTGIGGLTNMPIPVVETILHGLTEIAEALPEPATMA